MPLKKSPSKKARKENIKEMIHSKTFAKGKSKAKKIQMAVAAGYATQRSSKDSKDDTAKAYKSAKRGK